MYCLCLVSTLQKRPHNNQLYLLPILVNERENEPTLIKKANQFIPIKFGQVQLFDVMTFFDAAASLDSISKAYRTSETKVFFPYEWFDPTETMQNIESLQYHAFYSKLRSCNTLNVEYRTFLII